MAVPIPRSARRGVTPVAALAVALALAGCGSDPDDVATPGTPAPTGEMTEEMTEGTTEESPTGGMTGDPTPQPTGDMTTEGMTTEGMAEPTATPTAAEGAAPASPVVGISATAPDGTVVSPAQFDGRPVFVETFATWCSNCRRQLGDTQRAAAQAGDDAVFLALSVETTIDPAGLADYAAEHGFSDLRFGVLDDASLAVLADELGTPVLNPPSTPTFTIAPDGTVGALATGYESVDEILARLGVA